MWKCDGTIGKLSSDTMNDGHSMLPAPNASRFPSVRGTRRIVKAGSEFGHLKTGATIGLWSKFTIMKGTRTVSADYTSGFCAAAWTKAVQRGALNARARLRPLDEILRQSTSRGTLKTRLFGRRDADASLRRMCTRLVARTTADNTDRPYQRRQKRLELRQPPHALPKLPQPNRNVWRPKRSTKTIARSTPDV